MRYPASEKLEIIKIVEQSHLPAKKTLDQFGIARRTFYRWYDRYQSGGPAALEDRRPLPGQVWNRIPDDIRGKIFYPLVSGRENGGGLGLSLAQSFVEQHQGAIDVDSRPGRTCFTVFLPISREADA